MLKRSKMDKFNDLPYEMYFEIMLYMDVKTLHSFMQVNKFIHSTYKKYVLKSLDFIRLFYMNEDKPSFDSFSRTYRMFSGRYPIPEVVKPQTDEDFKTSFFSKCGLVNRIILDEMFRYNKLKKKDHFFVAGGFVLSTLKDKFDFNPAVTGKMDIDVFLLEYGENGEQMHEYLREVLLASEIRIRSANREFVVIKNSSTINIHSKPIGSSSDSGKTDLEREDPPLQIVLRRVHCIEELLCFFDLDACRFGFNGDSVFTTYEGIRALTIDLNVVKYCHFYKELYFRRTMKYNYKGYTTVFRRFQTLHPFSHLFLKNYEKTKKRFKNVLSNLSTKKNKDNNNNNLLDDNDKKKKKKKYFLDLVGGKEDTKKDFNIRYDSRKFVYRADIGLYTPFVMNVRYSELEQIVQLGVEKYLEKSGENYQETDFDYDGYEDNNWQLPLKTRNSLQKVFEKERHLFFHSFQGLYMSDFSIYLTSRYFESHLWKKYDFARCYVCGKYKFIEKDFRPVKKRKEEARAEWEVYEKARKERWEKEKQENSGPKRKKKSVLKINVGMGDTDFIYGDGNVPEEVEDRPREFGNHHHYFPSYFRFNEGEELEKLVGKIRPKDSFCDHCLEKEKEMILRTIQFQENKEMKNKNCVVTGGRIKLGYSVALSLLRAGGNVFVTTRFSKDAWEKYRNEEDFDEFQERLQIYPLNLKKIEETLQFCEYLKKKVKDGRIHAFFNCAAQTVRRPISYYYDLVKKETKDIIEEDEMENQNNSGHAGPSQIIPFCPPPNSQDFNSSYLAVRNKFFSEQDIAKLERVKSLKNRMRVRSLQASFDTLTEEDYVYVRDEDLNQKDFPRGKKDVFGEQKDNRSSTSWTKNPEEVDPIEVFETQVINQISPSVLIQRLFQPLLQIKPYSKEVQNHDLSPCYVINVTSIEGQFSIDYKEDTHHHTNMSKSGINMFTRTSSAYFAKFGVIMNSVDTGWVSSYSDDATWRSPPLNLRNGMTRILQPVVSKMRKYGRLLKNYEEVDW